MNKKMIVLMTYFRRIVESLSLLSTTMIAAVYANTIGPNTTPDPTVVLEGDVVEYSIRTPIRRRHLKLAPSGTAYHVSVSKMSVSSLK